MGQRKKQSSHEYNHSPTTLLVALFGGACVVLTVESIAGDANGYGVAADGQSSSLAIAYGIGMHGDHNILCVLVHSGIPGNKVQDNRMAIKRAVVASRRIYGVGNTRSHSVLHRAPSRCQLCRVGLPPNVQCAPLTEI